MFLGDPLTRRKCHQISLSVTGRKVANSGNTKTPASMITPNRPETVGLVPALTYGVLA